ncbi:hypothetical protein HMPREF2625_06870 [Rothia sp. HMSC064D08]|jgi:hypothetical protein|uniref:hypothetical protein n=1 Tax=Rothia TaxID=32207 RepID=UPI0008A366CE|nr:MULTISPECIES: hypothetical protein [Rothia]OFN05087.1 hypothetical protein HMPREF2625_06870 [Rothia sp. HMSC064D08]PLA19260.1 hypothetical protein CYK04_00030 [Rothia dentocariosa]
MGKKQQNSTENADSHESLEEADYQEFETQLQAVLAMDPVERIRAYGTLVDNLEDNVRFSREHGENS